jgi:hypothetical protein
MAKNEYFRIVYIVLKHLYATMKSGQGMDENSRRHRPADIPEGYWAYILESMQEDGLVKGVETVRAWGGEIVYTDHGDMCITPKGIEYLQENCMMRKVQRVLAEVKDAAPFV